MSWRKLKQSQQVQIAKRILQNEETPLDLAKEYGVVRTDSFVRHIKRKQADGSLAELAKVKLEDDDLVEMLQPYTLLEPWREWVEREEKKPGWRELLSYAQTGAEIQSLYRPDIRRARRTIITNKPVQVVFASDFHLGSPHTDYHAFLSTSDYIIENDIYLVVVGPDLEAAFRWFRDSSAVLNQVLPPWLQIESYRQWLDEMMPKTLAVCGDNHVDQRLERYMGDIGLVWRDELPYFRAYGILELAIGPDEDNLQIYTVVVSHKWKGHSIYHNLQPAFRMMRDIHPLADLYVTAHTHEPAHLEGVFYPEARETAAPYQEFIVTGTFKTGADLYSLRNFGQGVYGVPIVQFWPNEHRQQYFKGPEQLEAIRGHNV